MTPRIKASCSIFWITGILTFAYLLGIRLYMDTLYVPQNAKLNTVNMVVVVVCLIISVLTICGCCLIFCDITNFACILLYIIPLMFVVPGLCAFALEEIGQAELVTNTSLKKFIIQDWGKRKNPPVYLAQTQVQRTCCGIHGPIDYRQFIYGESCERTPLDVPFSCCNLSTLFRRPPLQIVNDTCGVRGKDNNIFLTKCKGLFENIFTINTSLVYQESNVSLAEEDFEDKGNLCKYANPQTAKLKEEYKDLIYSKGCLEYFVETNELIVNGNYMFLIACVLVTLTMLIVFLKNWCNSPEVMELTPHRTNSHLSDETLILEVAKSQPLVQVLKSL